MQQSFTDGNDLSDIASFLNRSEMWFPEKLLLAINFVKDFMYAEDIQFDRKIPFGLQTNEVPISYNIVMLMILCQKYKIEVDDLDTSEELYYMLQVITASDIELRKCIIDPRNIQRVRSTSMRRMIVSNSLQFYDGSTINGKEKHLQKPELYRCFDSSLSLNDYRYVDLEHLAWSEGSELEKGLSNETYYQWLQQNPPSLLFHDQITHNDELPTRTILEKKVSKYPEQQRIYSVDLKYCTSIGEILLPLSQVNRNEREGKFFHPFNGKVINRRDILKLRRRFLDAHNIPLFRTDYESIDKGTWIEIIEIGRVLRSRGHVDLETIHLRMMKLNPEINTFGMIRFIDKNNFENLGITFGERINLMLSDNTLPESCSILNSNYFIHTGYYACRLLNVIIYENPEHFHFLLA